MFTFMSYQTADRHVASRVRELFAKVGIDSFMAHDDIEVSAEWRKTILAQIRKADLFVAILSANYYSSHFCMQESGIAVFRKSMTIIPLSIDGTIPPGFMSTFQSTKIDPNNPQIADIMPSIFRHDPQAAMGIFIEGIRHAKSFRGAEAAFDEIRPYLDRARDEDIVALLVASTDNDQVCNAGLCAQKYLPPLVASHGHLMPPDKLARLNETLARYRRPSAPPQRTSNLFGGQVTEPVFVPESTRNKTSR